MLINACSVPGMCQPHLLLVRLDWWHISLQIFQLSNPSFFNLSVYDLVAMILNYSFSQVVGDGTGDEDDDDEEDEDGSDSDDGPGAGGISCAQS
jgi:hypothetical protein